MIKPLYPSTLEKKFRKVYMKHLSPFLEEAEEELTKNTIKQVSLEDEIIADLQGWVSSFIFWHRNKMRRINGQTGIQIFDSVDEDILKKFVSLNAGLIKDLQGVIRNSNSNEILERIFRKGFKISKENIKKSIKDELGVSESKAEFWARDQVAKLNSDIDEYKFGHSGIEWVVWATARDERTRETHRRRDGKVYRMKDGLDGLKPGQDYNCRCVAIPASDEQVINRES